MLHDRCRGHQEPTVTHIAPSHISRRRAEHFVSCPSSVGMSVGMLVSCPRCDTCSRNAVRGQASIPPDFTCCPRWPSMAGFVTSTSLCTEAEVNLLLRQGSLATLRLAGHHLYAMAGDGGLVSAESVGNLGWGHPVCEPLLREPKLFIRMLLPTTRRHGWASLRKLPLDG